MAQMPHFIVRHTTTGPSSIHYDRLGGHATSHGQCPQQNVGALARYHTVIGRQRCDQAPQMARNGGGMARVLRNHNVELHTSKWTSCSFATWQWPPQFLMRVATTKVCAMEPPEGAKSDAGGSVSQTICWGKCGGKEPIARPGADKRRQGSTPPTKKVRLGGVVETNEEARSPSGSASDAKPFSNFGL